MCNQHAFWIFLVIAVWIFPSCFAACSSSRILVRASRPVQSEAEVGERRGASTCHPFHPLHLWESETALCDMVRSFPAPNKICLFVGSLGQDVVADLTKKARFAENCMNVHKQKWITNQSLYCFVLPGWSDECSDHSESSHVRLPVSSACSATRNEPHGVFYFLQKFAHWFQRL